MSSCRIVDKETACFTDALGVPATVYANSVYDANGAVIAMYYTDTAGVVVDTSVGTVSAGSCAVAQPDVEWEQLCDVQTDGTVVGFIRRSITRFDAGGAVIDPVVVNDFEADKVTAYTVTGVVGDCDTCPVETPLGLITDLSLLA